MYVLENYLDSKAFFFLECYIFIFCLFSGSENYFKEVTDALSNYTHPKSRFVFTSSGGVFTGRNYILHNILLSSLNNSPAAIINNYFYFLTKSSMVMLKYRYLISLYVHTYKCINIFMWAILLYTIYAESCIKFSKQNKIAKYFKILSFFK